MTPFQAMMFATEEPPLVDLHNATVSDRAIGVNDGATSSFTINTNGNFTSVGNNGAPSWLWRLLGVSADYEVMFSYSGSAPTGVTFDTWMSCSTSRTVSLTASKIQDKTSNVLVQMRKASAPGVIIDACTIEMSATGGST